MPVEQKIQSDVAAIIGQQAIQIITLTAQLQAAFAEIEKLTPQAAPEAPSKKK